MSSGDAVTTKWVEEVTFGVTPTDSPDWFYTRYLSENLLIEPNFVESGLISPHRQTSDLVKTGADVSGPYNTELVEGEFDKHFAAVFNQADWTADVLKFGLTKRSFSQETEFTDLTNKFKQFTGVRINTCGFNFTIGQIALVNFGLIGLTGKDGSASLVGLGSVAPASTNRSFETGAGITTLEVRGAATTATLRSVQININNNLRGIPGLGSDGNTDVVDGAIQVEGTAEFYLNDESYDHWVDKLNGTFSDIRVKTELPNSAAYDLEVPRIKWRAGGPGSQGRNTDVMASLGFTGTYDPTELTSLILTRTVGV